MSYSELPHDNNEKLINGLKHTPFGLDSTEGMTVQKFLGKIDDKIRKCTSNDLSILVAIEHIPDFGIRSISRFSDSAGCWGLSAVETNLTLWSVWDALWWAERVTGLTCVVDDDCIVLVDSDLITSLNDISPLFDQFSWSTVQNGTYVPEGLFPRKASNAHSSPFGRPPQPSLVSSGWPTDDVVQTEEERIRARLEKLRVREIVSNDHLVGEKWLRTDVRNVQGADAARVVCDILPKSVGLRLAYCCNGSIGVMSFIYRSFTPWTEVYKGADTDELFGGREVGELTLYEMLYLLKDLYGVGSFRDKVLIISGRSDNGLPRLMRSHGFALPPPKSNRRH